jgi:hypothetical protein
MTCRKEFQKCEEWTLHIHGQSKVIVLNLNNYNKDGSLRVLLEEKSGDPSPRVLLGDPSPSLRVLLEEKKT